jgi:hypothetical protein
MKKGFVLVALFVLPLVAYLFFASGVNQFGKLPVLTEGVQEIQSIDSEQQLTDRITILGFLGEDPSKMKGNLFNLNQKIYKRFYEFKDFQMLMVMPEGTEAYAEGLKKEVGELSDPVAWHFAFASKDEIKQFYSSLKSPLPLEDDLSTPYVYIIDKKLNLRGRNDDEDQGTKYGFDTRSVADLNNKMEDDVKVILAEYRLALKKNNEYLVEQ